MTVMDGFGAADGLLLWFLGDCLVDVVFGFHCGSLCRTSLLSLSFDFEAKQLIFVKIQHNWPIVRRFNVDEIQTNHFPYTYWSRRRGEKWARRPRSLRAGMWRRAFGEDA
jgi:hypothetical protein